MSLKSIEELKSELKKFNINEKRKIKEMLFQEFKDYVYKIKFDIDDIKTKSYLTKAFCEFISLSYINSFEDSIFNSKNYKFITDYIQACKKQIRENSFNNFVIITAQPVSKNDKEINEIINYITNNLRCNVSIKNLNWYDSDYFLKEIKLYKSVIESQKELKKIFYKYDEKLFNQVTDDKFKGIKIDFKDLWHNFFNKEILISLEKFLHTPIKIDEANLQNKINKIINTFEKDTIYIFLNNVETKSYYKTALLNDLDIFYNIIKYDCPIYIVGENKFFNLLKPLVMKEMKNLNEFNFLLNKKIDIKETENKNDITNTLSRYWTSIVSDSKNESILNDEIENKKKNLKEDTQDLLAIANLNENNFETIIKEITGEQKEYSNDQFKNEKKEFEGFIYLFDKVKDEIELTTTEIDKSKYEKFKKIIDSKNIIEVMDFLIKQKTKIINVLKLKKISKQNIMNFYALYLKVKDCLDEIEFINSNPEKG